MEALKDSLELLKFDSEGSYAKCIYEGAKNSVAGLEEYVVDYFDEED